MSAPLELFVLPWGVYPRRILLYLSEKGLLSSPLIKITAVEITQQGMSTPAGKPPGSVPILKLPDGTFIKQSLAILDYLEDICDHPDPEIAWQVELAQSAENTGSMRGQTAQDKARTRDMLSLIEEVNCIFGFAAHKGSKLFVPMETTSALASKLALEYCAKMLKALDEYYGSVRALDEGRPVTIADCALFSLLQFSKGLYDLDLASGFPNLTRFYEVFEKRESARVEDDHFPEQIRELARQWLPIE